MRVAATVGGNGARAEPVAAVDADAAPSSGRQQARLGILSEAMRAFAEATEDPSRVIDTVARRVAEVIRDYCVVLLASDDGLRVEPAAAFDPDPDTCRRLREALSEPLLLERHALVREVFESGVPFLAPTLDLSRLPQSAQIGQLMRDIGIHSLLVVALRAQARATGTRAIGVLILARFRSESPPFDLQDLELAQNLAAHAALAITNARLLAEARWESVEKKRMADRLRVLTDAARDFAATTFDLEVLVQVVVRRLGEEVGDLCSLRMTSHNRRPSARSAGNPSSRPAASLASRICRCMSVAITPSLMLVRMVRSSALSFSASESRRVNESAMLFSDRARMPSSPGPVRRMR